ncbi:MAG: putative tRNA threonylcarbamoyladenosine biosynthesis protein Gcp [Candidatus Moranbacteria bacterium GW2011_GWF2_34_56]|nr:MAG: putative tRNA threonylcarbamoyladenosine biosynthesis protein Gcp [Candidatus Moranbacteria bacterium GW2011_GWF2_34_56]
MEDHFKYQIIGETQDDAVGEAFDKVARILGLGYPGGPIISAQAANHELRIMNYESNLNKLNSNEKKLSEKNIKKPIFPRPMLNSQDFNFSFSGLKTSVLYYVKKYRKENNLDDNTPLPEEFMQEVAYEFQEAATDILVIKTIQAAKKYEPKSIFLAGGVSANNDLREKMDEAIKKNIPHVTYLLQPIAYSTDNAAMIAVAAAYRWERMTSQEKNETSKNWKTLSANAQLKIYN